MKSEENRNGEWRQLNENQRNCAENICKAIRICGNENGCLWLMLWPAGLVMKIYEKTILI